MKSILFLITICLVSIICTSCQTGKEKAKSSGTPTIYVAANGTLSLEGEKFEAKDLLSKLKNKGIKNTDAIIIDVETKTKHQVFMPVFEELAKGKYTRISVIGDK